MGVRWPEWPKFGDFPKFQILNFDDWEVFLDIKMLRNLSINILNLLRTSYQAF